MCRSGFTVGAASVACKAMGYSGTASSETNLDCRDALEHNLCGGVEPRISEVSCSGQEASIVECPHEEDDNVFCAPEESVVIHCNGDGNPEGRGRKSVSLKADVMK